MTKWIGRPILLCLVAAAGVLTTTGIASAVGSTPTTTGVVITSPASPVIGQPVTYTVTVNGTGGGADPTGSVTFTDLANSSGGCTSAPLVLTAPAATAGVSTATCTTTYTKAEGPSTFTATYAGDTIYAGSTGTTSTTIGAGSTTTTIAAATQTPVTGQSVAFTATVKPVAPAAGTPTGTVAFTEITGNGPSVPASCASVTISAAGTAVCNVTVGLSPALPTIHAVYTSGDTNFTGSTDGTDATITSVGSAATRVLLASSANPSQSGQPVTFTATVAATTPGTGVPTGSVTFSGVTCTGSNTATLSTGSATCSVAAGQLLTANSPVTVSASYSGVVYTAGPPTIGAYSASSSTFSQTVSQDSTTTTLIVSPKKPTVNGSVSLTAIVISPPPASGTMTGAVSFLILGKHSGPLSCAAPVVNNVIPLSGSNEVTCNIASLPADANPIKVTVSYSGDSNYLGSSTKTKRIALH